MTAERTPENSEAERAMSKEETQHETEETFQIHINGMDVLATGWSLFNSKEKASQLAQATSTSLINCRKSANRIRDTKVDGDHYETNHLEARYSDGEISVAADANHTEFNFDLTYDDGTIDQKLRTAATFICSAATLKETGQQLDALEISFDLNSYRAPPEQPDEGQEVQTITTEKSRIVMQHTLWWENYGPRPHGNGEDTHFISIGIEALIAGPELPDRDRLIEVMKAAYNAGTARLLELMDPNKESVN